MRVAHARFIGAVVAVILVLGLILLSDLEPYTKAGFATVILLGLGLCYMLLRTEVEA